MPEIILGVLVLVLSGCVVAFLVTQRRKRAMLKRLAAALCGRLAGNTVTVGSGSSAYDVTYFERSGNSRGQAVQTGLMVRVNYRSRGSFLVLANAIGRINLLQDIGSEQTVLTGDPGFDRSFMVQAAAVDFVSVFLSAPEKRQAIREIFALGVDLLRHDGIVFETTGFFPSAEPMDVDSATITGIVAQLSTLKMDLPSA